MFAQTVLDRLVERLCTDLVILQNVDGGWSFSKDAGDRVHGVLRAASRTRDLGSSTELTSGILDVFSHCTSVRQFVIERAAAFLRATQRGDGSWDSTTGARLLHGTSWAIRGLIAAGASLDDPAIAAGVNWLLAHQQTCGGWGEAALCIDAGGEFVPAAATAVQTAWVLLALVVAGFADQDATRRGIEFLLGSQLEDGGWEDKALTVRDSPTGTWYRNDLHSAALPLMALSRWTVTIAERADETTTFLRLVTEDADN
jgi:squalene-hopene/tetraprenyl-beta-curcumene cyclase